MIRVTIIAQGAEEVSETKEFTSGQISIGRLGRNDLVLVSSRVSSMHARAVVAEHGVTVIDNNSTNGTFVNGTMVRGPVTVEPEDSVEIGSFTLHFENITAAEEPLEDDGPGIAPEEFDELVAAEPSEFGEPDLLPLDAGPGDAFGEPESLLLDSEPEPEPERREATPFEMRSPLHTGTVPDSYPPPRSRGGGRAPVEGPTGLSGAFESTVVALAPSPMSERTEARALACARDAVELCCPEMDPRQRRQWSEWIAQEVVGLGPLTDLLADASVSEVLVLGARELDLLKVRSRDVLEHIERVVHHVRRLEQSTETAVQMHFSVQSNRTNDIMRTLTALTAVFLPLNLIAGIFGMNFDFIPLIHKADGFWWATASMALIAVALVALFWRKQYLSRTRR